MNASPRTIRNLGLLLALLALPAVAWQQRGLNAQRDALDLTRQPALENAPPVIAFTTVALGGFRGMLANALWLRAVRLQDEGNYFELLTLGDWITKLQPDFAMVWAQQAWNMTYNVSRTFARPEDRWLWVRSGIELLRDEGLRHNPDEPELYRELSWFFHHKLGQAYDEAHRYYKTRWAGEMMEVLGNPPDWESLIRPETEEDRNRAARLREVYRLDPAFMRELDQQYGPFEWRLPEAHAVYWAALGLRHAPPGQALPLRRALWQAMNAAFLRGRLIWNSADQRLEVGPNLAMLESVDRAFEEMKAAEPDRADYIANGQRSFLQDAVYYLYTHNRLADAARWYAEARRRFPDFSPPGMDLDAFVVRQVEAELERTNFTRTRGLIEGFIGQYYYHGVLGDMDRAEGHLLLARKIHDRYQTVLASRGERMALPSFIEMQREVVRQIEAGGHGFTPALRAQLEQVRSDRRR